jgi:glycerol uptake facilitator-like aquaporin
VDQQAQVFAPSMQTVNTNGGPTIINTNFSPGPAKPAGHRPQGKHPAVHGRSYCGSGMFRSLLDRRSWLMQAVRECLATYACAFVFFASVAAMVVDVGYLAIGRGFINGLTCFLFGGAFANPMLSLAAVCSRKIRVSTFFAQIVAQFIGVVLAATTAQYGLGLDLAHATPAATSTTAGFVAEFIGTFLMSLCVAAACEETHWRLRALFVGLAYIPVVIAIGPISGGFIDPFLALGAAMFSYFTTSAWLYYAAPIVGSFVAAIVVAVAHLRDIHDGDVTITPLPK